MIPTAKLGVECWMVNPPQPGAVGVMVDGKVIAVIELDEFKKTYQRLLELEEARK